MTDPVLPTAAPPESASPSARPHEVLASEVERRAAALAEDLGRGRGEEVDARLQALAALVAVRDAVAKKRPSRLLPSIAMGVVCAILVTLAAIEQRHTPVELEVHATRLSVDLTAADDRFILPGEMGEVVGSSSARVLGVEDSDPSIVGPGTELALEPLLPASLAGTGGAPIRIQEFGIPPGERVQLTVSDAYSDGKRGALLSAEAASPTVARIGQLVPASVKGPDGRSREIAVLGAIRASGRRLALEFYPLDSARQLTVLRNTRASAIRFKGAEQVSTSTVLSGVLELPSGVRNRLPLLPGDSVEIASDRDPLFIREVTIANGVVVAKVTCSTASVVAIGPGVPRSAKPSLLEYLNAVWPAQLYATATAVVAFLWTFARWWRHD